MIYALSLAPGAAVLKGHDWGVLIGVLGVLLAVLFWLAYVPERPVREAMSLSVMLLIGAAWTWQVIRTQVDGGLFNVTAFAVPVILVLVALKGVSLPGYVTAMTVLGWSMFLISVLSLTLGAIGLTPSGFAVADSGPCRLPVFCEVVSAWPGATESLGMAARWGGPFGSVNLAAPMGGLIALIGFLAPGRVSKAALIPGGLLVLLLGQSRTAMLAFGFALLVMALWGRRVSSSRFAILVRIAVLGSAISLAALLVRTLDPSLNGRAPIWSFYFELWRQDWFLGVGGNGVLAAVRGYSDDVSFVLHDHAHSVLLDGAARFGAPALVLGLSVYALVVWSGVRAARSWSPVPLSLAVYVIVVGLADTVYSWIYWTAYMATMVFIAMSVPAHSRHAGGPSAGPT